MNEEGRRSSPHPPPPATPYPASVTGTGQHRALVVSDPDRPESTAERALRISLENRRQIGRPPVAATNDPGEGIWVAVAEVKSDCKEILRRLDAQDAASARWGGAAGRVIWRLVEVIIPLLVGAVILWASGHIK